MAATGVDFSDFHQEPDLTAQMRMPETIRVEPQHSDSFYQTSTGGASDNIGRNMADPMCVPERIVINGEMGVMAGRTNDISEELKDDFIPSGTVDYAYMGGMTTPPRTLTVDDTTSAHYPQAKPAAGGQRKTGELKMKSGHHMKQMENREMNHMLDESIKTGLEIIDEVHPMEDSEEEYATEYEVTDLRKSVSILHRRVSMLEREVDNNSFGYWSKVFVFAMTVINPLMLQWLFGGRRR